MNALLLRELLDGISEHCPRHMEPVPFKEIHKKALIALANLSQHPSYSLLHQVVLRIKQDFSQSYRVVILPVTYEHKGGDYSNPAFPHVRRVSKMIKYAAVSAA